MGYEKPYIDAAGLFIPSYTDVRDDMVSKLKGIYGEDVYLEPDSQDYQLVSSYADKVSDLLHGLQLVYNNQRPATAIGGALDSMVKLNGIRRKRAGNSIAELLVTGAPGTIIHNGKAGDGAGNLWRITGTITIPATGTVRVEAVCDTAGVVYADAGSINRIITPTLGWVSVTNPAKAITGQDAETDAVLRARQTISTARPSRTVLLGTYGGIMEQKDVIRCKVYENDNGFPDEHGIPGHTISAVVEGGDAEDIATEIYYRKTPGTGTFGDVEVAVTEETEENPIECPPIKFFRPSYIDAVVRILVHKKQGYVEQTTVDITQKVTAYLNRLEIGTDLVVSALYSPILCAMADITNPSFSITSVSIGKDSGSLAEADIPILFNEVTRGIPTNVTVEVV